MPSARRIVGLFLGAVLVCGVFFALGYLTGSYLMPEAPSPPPPALRPGQAPPPSGAALPAQEVPSTPHRLTPPLIPRGAFIVQVAALASQGEAFAIGELLEKKGYPAFVVAPPASGNIYRVEVGPYADADSADLAKRSLGSEGFKPFVRRQRSHVPPWACFVA